MKSFKEFVEANALGWSFSITTKKHGKHEVTVSRSSAKSKEDAEEYIKNHPMYKKHKPTKIEYMKEEKDPRLAKAGVAGFNKPKRTPSHPEKSHIVVAKSGDQVKTIRFGEQGAETAGAPKKGESDRMKAKRKSFKARHAKNIAKGKMSAAFWADKVKW
jgi:hypothetical protein